MTSALLFCLVSLSLLAFGLAIWCYAQVRRLLRGASMRSLAELRTEVSDLSSLFASLHASHRRLVARISMREARAEARLSRESSDEGLHEPSADGREATLNKLRDKARAKGLIK